MEHTSDKPLTEYTAQEIEDLFEQEIGETPNYLLEHARQAFPESQSSDEWAFMQGFIKTNLIILYKELPARGCEFDQIFQTSVTDPGIDGEASRMFVMLCAGLLPAMLRYYNENASTATHDEAVKAVSPPGYEPTKPHKIVSPLIWDIVTKLFKPKLKTSTAPTTPSRNEWPLQTSQENQAIYFLLSDGRMGRHYKVTADGFVHQRPGSSHYTKLIAGDEIDAMNREAMIRLRDQMDADSMFAFAYVQALLSPTEPLPKNTRRSIWVSLDDIIQTIGPAPRSTDERRQRRQEVFSMLRYVEQAQVIGDRTRVYKDGITKELIPTIISTSPWQIGNKEWPEQTALFGGEPPIRVELTQSREWTDLCSNSSTAQFLEGCESVGQIPGNKPSGAWARVIAITLMIRWKIDPKFDKKPLTRRHLLTTYPPKKASIDELLSDKNPGRIITYWHEAIRELETRRFIAPSKETATKKPSGYGWADAWLDERADLLPGDLMKQYVEERAARAPSKPAERTLPDKRRRPRKAT